MSEIDDGGEDDRAIERAKGKRGENEERSGRKSERGYRYTRRNQRRGERDRGGGREKKSTVRHYPRSPVADQSPYVKRHFLWVPLGRPVCVIKIDLSPLLFFPPCRTTETPVHGPVGRQRGKDRERSGHREAKETSGKRGGTKEKANG